MKYRLYRVQLFQQQSDLVSPPPSAPIALRQLLDSRPRIELATRQYFITNLRYFENNFVAYFRIARRRIARLTELKGDELLDVERPDYPYADIVLDLKLQAAAISHSARFSASVDYAADRLSRLLAASKLNSIWQFSVNVDAVKDPTSFLDYLRSSRLVLRFYFDVRRPNVYDPDEIVQAIKKLNKEARSKTTRTALRGDNIEKGVAARLTKAAAASGNDAGATMLPTMGRGTIRRSLGKNPVDFIAKVEDASEDERITVVLSILRERFRQVNQPEDSGN